MRARPTRLTSSSESETPENMRWLVIEALKGVGGASLKRDAGFALDALVAPSPRLAARRAASAVLATSARVRPAAGSSFAICTTC